MKKLVFIILFILGALSIASPYHYGYQTSQSLIRGNTSANDVGICSATHDEWERLSQEFVDAFIERDSSKSGKLTDYIAHAKQLNIPNERSDRNPVGRLINYKKFLNEQLQELDRLEGEYYSNIYNLCKVLSPIYIGYWDWFHLCDHRSPMKGYWKNRKTS